MDTASTSFGKRQICHSNCDRFGGLHSPFCKFSTVLPQPDVLRSSLGSLWKARCLFSIPRFTNEQDWTPRRRVLLRPKRRKRFGDPESSLRFSTRVSLVAPGSNKGWSRPPLLAGARRRLRAQPLFSPSAPRLTLVENLRASTGHLVHSRSLLGKTLTPTPPNKNFSLSKTRRRGVQSYSLLILGILNRPLAFQRDPNELLRTSG